LSGFLVLNGGKVALIEGHNFTPEFLSTAVAEKAEQKLFRGGMVDRFSR
jgi:hypothetical protein